MTDKNIQHYVISCEPYVYGATITKDEYLERHLIKFGGKKACVQIAVYDNIPNIDGIGYGKRCALNKSLEPCIGTEHLVKTAMRFVCELYPNTNAFALKDTTFMTCSDGDIMNLWILYIAKYGETWYQKKYGAKAVRPENVDEAIKQINKILTSKKMKNFKTFRAKYLRLTKIEEMHLEQCEKIYNKSTSLRNFIIELCKEFDCSFMRDWLPILIADTRPTISNLEIEEFLIDKDTINSWNLPALKIETTDETTFQKKSKPFIMNVHKGGKKKKLDPYLTQPLLYSHV